MPVADQPIDTTDQQAVTVAQETMTRPGYVVWHSSEEDGGPDVGLTIGLGGGKMLWAGERSGREGDGIGLLVYGDKSIDANASLGEYDEVREVLEQHVAPALSRLASVSSASAETADWIPSNYSDTPEPVPATNQAGEVEEQAPYTWRLDQSESESLFAALHGLTCSRDIHDIPDVMEAVTDIFRSTVGGDATRRRSLDEFGALAESINDSPALMSVYAAPEWDELDDNGQQWVSALVRETMARCRQDYADAIATQPATSQEGEGLALRAIKAVTATAKDGAAGLSRIMAITNAAGVQAPYSDLLQDPAVALIVERPRTEWAHLFKPDATGCAIPPDGWQCSRARGHTGPCAATPTPPTLSEDLREALEKISRLRPYGDVETCKSPRRLVEQMERIAVAALLAQPAPSQAESPYVAGTIWAEAEDDCFTAEVQIVGGHAVVATVHGATHDEAESRQSAVIAALAQVKAS